MRRWRRNLINRLMPHTGKSSRLGITGVPGVGKSAFIDAFGCLLTGQGHRVAVLSIDPTSVRSGGSVLGDKARMTRLSVDPNAFIRASPSGLVLGGTARKTRETMLLCEAAGYDVVLIETVGVGQSEVAVANMTDMLLVLMLAGAGDELQGIKRGLLELADMIAITKADGANVTPAKMAAARYTFAMELLHAPADRPQVVVCSALEGTGLEAMWRVILDRTRGPTRQDAVAARRAEQATTWMWALVDEKLREAMRHTPAIRAVADESETAVRAGLRSPVSAAEAIVRVLRASGG
ncbi:MAG: methylmalonyl Co-A mutase-associated GTPase MeaB [Thermomicrobiales bacterium]